MEDNDRIDNHLGQEKEDNELKMTANMTSARLQKRSTFKSTDKGVEKVEPRASQDYYGAIATTDIQVLGPQIVKEINDFKKKIGSSKFQRMIVQLIGDLMKIRSFQRSVKEFLKTIGTTVRTTTNEATETPKKKIQISDDSMDYDY